MQASHAAFGACQVLCLNRTPSPPIAAAALINSLQIQSDTALSICSSNNSCNHAGTLQDQERASQRISQRRMALQDYASKHMSSRAIGTGSQR